MKKSHALYKYFYCLFVTVLCFLSPFTNANALHQPLIATKTTSAFKWPYHWPYMDISADDKRLYFVSAENEIRILNLETNSVMKRLPDIKAFIIRLSPNEKTAYITNMYHFGVLDLESLELTTYIRASNYPYAMTVNQKGDRVYYAAIQERSVSIFNTETNEIKTFTQNAGNNHTCKKADYNGFTDIALSPDEKKVYIADPSNQALAVLDLTTDQLRLNAVPIPNHCPTSITVDRSGNRLYVGTYHDNTVDVVDTTKDEVIHSYAVGSSPRNVVITPDGKKAYVLNAGSNTVSVIDTQHNLIIKTLGSHFDSPWSGVSSKDGRKVYVANDNNELNISVIDTLTDEVVETIFTK